MSAAYDEGHLIGAEQARADLARNRRIAAQYAAARLAILADREGADDFNRGVLDGYRSTLANAASGNQSANR